MECASLFCTGHSVASSVFGIVCPTCTETYVLGWLWCPTVRQIVYAETIAAMLYNDALSE